MPSVILGQTKFRKLWAALFIAALAGTVCALLLRWMFYGCSEVKRIPSPDGGLQVIQINCGWGALSSGTKQYYIAAVGEDRARTRFLSATGKVTIKWIGRSMIHVDIGPERAKIHDFQSPVLLNSPSNRVVEVSLRYVP